MHQKILQKYVEEQYTCLSRVTWDAFAAFTSLSREQTTILFMCLNSTQRENAWAKESNPGLQDPLCGSSANHRATLSWYYSEPLISEQPALPPEPQLSWSFQCSHIPQHFILFHCFYFGFTVQLTLLYPLYWHLKLFSVFNNCNFNPVQHLNFLVEMQAYYFTIFCSFSHGRGLPDPTTLSVRPFVQSSSLLRPLWGNAVGTCTPRT